MALSARAREELEAEVEHLRYLQEKLEKQEAAIVRVLALDLEGPTAGAAPREVPKPEPHVLEVPTYELLARAEVPRET